MTELFTRYNPATPSEERRGAPICVVAHFLIDAHHTARVTRARCREGRT